ncbi:MAG: altronate dehydratase family protein [Prevotella sp.]|nr:altronate dehydratase family protein [Prevotella sp.]MDD6993709.1 altronate dehydratase family protein [Prevotella sp.]MDD7068892.1 altronate dehydratase family protein [Prevotella sp.]MDY2804962.1 altronate dehydratase family protein [Prevotella sp.]MDY3965473.1 altronate dehydratase family protein [Prevotella sp.]
MEKASFLKINPADSVVVCLRAMKAGETVSADGKVITLLQDVPAGHKVLIEDKNEGEDIIKYGYPIGHAKKNLKAGEWVDENNLKTNLAGTLEYTYNPVDDKLSIAKGNRTFKGYVRKNGDVGVRNEIWVVPTVGCVNGIAERVAKQLEEETKLEGIDAVHAWHHNYGCSQLSEDHEATRKVLRDIVLHPNAGAVLVLSLGCENNQPEDFMAMLGDYDKDRIKLVVTQRVEGDEVEECMNVLRNLYAIAKNDCREDVPVSKLRVGLKCGGSDGFSGITANPLEGEFSDWLVAQGGTSILTEVPEMFGAETILMNRCETRELFDKTVSLINNFKNYFLSHGEPVGENPSPGNKAGGISTLEDKALGCTQKCGRAPVSGVLEYGDRLQTTGLNLLSAPGNDLVASTALAAAGCHIVLFSTGRGTPFGTFVPTMKISTNSNLYNNKKNWIDFNAGQLVDGKSMMELVPEFIDKVLAVASGEQAQNEKNGYREISIFKNGVTL